MGKVEHLNFAETWRILYKFLLLSLMIIWSLLESRLSLSHHQTIPQGNIIIAPISIDIGMRFGIEYEKKKV